MVSLHLALWERDFDTGRILGQANRRQEDGGARQTSHCPFAPCLAQDWVTDLDAEWSIF